MDSHYTQSKDKINMLRERCFMIKEELRSLSTIINEEIICSLNSNELEYKRKVLKATILEYNEVEEQIKKAEQRRCYI